MVIGASSVHSEIGVLRAKVIVHNSPRRHRPAVIDLPDQRTSTPLSSRSLPLPFPQPISACEALSLHQLRAVDVLFERIELVLHVLNEVECYPSLMAVSLIVEIYGGRLRVSVEVLLPSGK
jgi:hypothetical protein